jgi:8-oxo-dGTP diphosphatase
MTFNTHIANTQKQPRHSGCLENCFGLSLCFIIFALEENSLKVLCKKATEDKGLPEDWMLPHGQVDADEGIHESARRSVQNLTRSAQVFHEQLQTFGGGGLTPLTVAYYALLPMENCSHMIPEQRGLCWWDVAQLPNLSAEHVELVNSAVRSIRLKASRELLIFHLLPDRFTLLQLQQAYEKVLNIRLGKSNFRRKVSRMKFVVPSQEWQQNVAHRAARLYKFDEGIYLEMCKNGIFLSF